MAHPDDRNVIGGPLEPCSIEPLTGFYRDGCCRSGPDDIGNHSVCTVVTREFLEHQLWVGNDLITARPEYGFAGLHPGDRWCVCAGRWWQAFEDGAGAPVVLAATHERALEVVPLTTLTQFAVDVPADPRGLT
jgi:uncharacterized protein (DUF2237 family)